MGKSYFKIDGNCYFCKDKKVIQHHISYAPEIIVLLCRNCHSKLHLLIKEYHNIILQKDKGDVNITKYPKEIKAPLLPLEELEKIINIPQKRSQKVKLIAETKQVSERHARRLLTKLENETTNITPNNRT